jgi:hypothetical protein
MEKILLCNIPMLSATFEPQNVRNDLMVQESSGEPSLWNRVSETIADLQKRACLCILLLHVRWHSLMRACVE